MQFTATKFTFHYVCVFLLVLLAGCSQSKFVVAPPFTNVDKISKIETGQSKEDINTTLGIKPFDILYLNDGNFMCYYNYRLEERRINIDNSSKNRDTGSGATLSSDEAQTAGEPFYTEWRRVYINFKDNKVTHYTTDAGLEGANYIQLVNGTIKLLNKQELKIENFYTQSIIQSDVNINSENGKSTTSESIDIEKVLFQLKHNGMFMGTKNVTKNNSSFNLKKKRKGL
jgi:hypothetical protein